MSSPARILLATLVAWALCAPALPAAADRASGTLSLKSTDGKVTTVEIRHGYFFEAPDPFGGPSKVRVLVLADEDVRAKIDACSSGRCAELAGHKGLVVKLWSDGSPPAYWAHIEAMQYSAPLAGRGLQLETDTAERIAGTLEIETDSVRARVSFDSSRLRAFASLD
jgi:hypothetical protein